jgi:beta-lactamase superfamily II metal-dependent hydrolase
VSLCATSCRDRIPLAEEHAFLERHLPAARRGHLRCYFFNTGTGDASLLVLPSGRTAVIDAGTRGGGDRAAGYLGILGADGLDVAILSHPDYDHYAGLGRLVRRFPPAEFYHSGLPSWTPWYRSFTQEIERSGCAVHTVRRGDAIPLGGDVTCRVLWPPRHVEPDSTSPHFANTNSLVLAIRFGDVSFLFCGDAKEDTEATLVRESRRDLKADVLKIAHHGSGSSSSREFLDAVCPDVAIVMGEHGNRERGAFGAASPETIARLEETASRIVRVCRTGSVLVETDGRRITTIATTREDTPQAEAIGSPER